MEDLEFTDIEDLEEDQDVAAALGDMIVAWQFAESAILFAMVAVTGMSTNQGLDAYYRIPTFESRVKFTLAAIEDWDAPKRYDRDAIGDAIKAINGLALTRNNWVHNVWGRGKQTGTIVVFNYRAAVDKGRRKPVKAHDIRLHTKTVLERSKALRRLVPDVP